ncbi:MAG: 23S rRNA (adenine(2030)-N(6))-methyltransferase RlmJ [Albidovulum sp.]
MLSYQHSYHAGNLADVHKHALLAGMLAYMAAKDKPLSYIETHAGRGLYALDTPEALKTGEAAAGIDRVRDRFAPDHPYAKILSDVQARYGMAAYPGSPLVAALSLRPGDRMDLAELHPAEFAALNDVMIDYAAHCRQQDGLQLALALTPPEPRRGLMLIDPSYEVKADYAALPNLVRKVHAKWNVGVIVLWYPILPANAHLAMLRDLESRDLPKPLRHEVRFGSARPGHGLVGSGMFIVNAPYGTDAEAVSLTRLFAGL